MESRVLSIPHSSHSNHFSFLNSSIPNVQNTQRGHSARLWPLYHRPSYFLVRLHAPLTSVLDSRGREARLPRPVLHELIVPQAQLPVLSELQTRASSIPRLSLLYPYALHSHTSFTICTVSRTGLLGNRDSQDAGILRAVRLLVQEQWWCSSQEPQCQPHIASLHTTHHRSFTIGLSPTLSSSLLSNHSHSHLHDII